VLLKALKRFWYAFDKATTTEGKMFFAIFLGSILIVAAAVIVQGVSDAYADYRANHASPTERLRLARGLCPPTSNGAVACVGPKMDTALYHLDKIPPSAPEYSDATELRSLIQAFRMKAEAARQKQEQALAAERAKQQAEHDRLTHQSVEESREQMLRNLLGQAHDSFTCDTSNDNLPIVSFDHGHYWWSDDGRCATQLQRAREAADREAQQKRWEEQKARDSEAELSSYWSTTIRVDTDMDSFWLVNEERTCQTYPNEKGRVAVVSCSAGGSHKDHNIPVKFWGGVDRSTVSEWRCRRESDGFVCRAIN